jgi:DNA (cytosine-5)-methyltransferase 1
VASRPRVLSLCAGYGGLDVGVRLACPGAVTVCYVERDVQAAAVLVKNAREAALDDAPIWSDLCTFDAAAWRGCVDLVVAGFPCQPASVAGKRGGRGDARWLWPEVARIIADSGASACFLENVPGLVSLGLQDVLLDLHAMGLDAEWGLFSAAEAGAPHKRERWFCLAYAGRVRPDWLQQVAEQGRRKPAALGGDEPALANSDGHGLEGERVGGLRDDEQAELRNDADRCGGASNVGDSDRIGELEPDDSRGAVARQDTRPGAGGTGWELDWPPGPEELDRWAEYLRLRPGSEPAVCGGAHGTAGRMDRLRILGNGAVPQQVAIAFSDLASRVTP